MDSVSFQLSPSWSFKLEIENFELRLFYDEWEIVQIIILITKASSAKFDKVVVMRNNFLQEGSFELLPSSET